MKKQLAILAAATACAAVRPVCADLVDDFNRPDGPIAGDSLGINPDGTQKFSYTERQSPAAGDMVDVARIENDKLRIFGNGAGTSLLTNRQSSAGIVTLTGYNNPYPAVSATVAFDQGSLNTQASTIAANNASGGSLTADRIGFILRAPTNMFFNSPGNPNTQGGFIDAQIGPNGDILIRELKNTGTLLSVYSKNPWNNAGTDAKLHPGKLPATINGLPFDTNQDGLLEPDEPFTLTLQIINNGDTGNQDFVEMLINGVDVPGSTLAGGLLQYQGGNASGTNSVALFKNRVSSGVTSSVISDGIFDDLNLSPLANNTTTTAWSADADGNWGDNGNWTNSAPYGLDSQVTFGNTITAPHTVTLTAGEVAGTLNFDSAVSYTLNNQVASFTAGTSHPTTTTNLTLASATGAVGINVSAGTHTINADIVAKNDATISVAANSSLLIANTFLSTGSGAVTIPNGNASIQLSGSGYTLTKTGLGSVAFGAVRVGTFVLTDGAASITAKTTSNSSAGTSVVGSLSIGSGHALDLANNDLILNYANGGAADPAKTAFIRQLITSGYANGAWTGTGLTSSSAAAVAADSGAAFKTALGYAEASDAGITPTFDGVPVDNDMVLVRYTFVADANLDGKVDTSDFDKLALGFGKTDAGWVDGDFNYDGVVNALDFNALASQYGATGAVPSASMGVLVPEPTAVAIFTSLLGLASVRRRRAARVC